MLKTITFFALLLATVQSEVLVLEKRDAPPAGFLRVGPTPADQILNLRLALTQGNIAGLQDTVYEINTPGNTRYGQYLTLHEVNSFMAPTEETVAAVNSWLASKDLTARPITPAGDWISVNTTASQANELLAADFSTFQNQETNQTVVRTLSYSIPGNLTGGISWVHPTVNFPSAKALGIPSLRNTPSRAASGTFASPSISPNCRENSSWTPQCLQELYSIPSAPAKPVANVFGVSGFDDDFANKRDLKAFLVRYRLDMNPNTTFDLISVDDGINNQLPAGAGIVSDPAIQYTVGLATGVLVTFISTGELPNDFYTEMLDQAHSLLLMANPPQTVLNTWGSLESQVSAQIAISLCNVYAQLAARGVSYIVSTGALGGGVSTGGIGPGGCMAFDPPFPATCPFVIAVGATQFNVNATQETASSFSGGGFSNFFKRPTYQDTAVEGYLESASTQNTGFNVSSRAGRIPTHHPTVPDVSAIDQVQIILNGVENSLFASTSFSAAIFASIIALLSNERIAAGKPGLGFLNPLLYQNPSAFTDMTVGNNIGGCNTVAFNATAGWDPISGFGSPIYPKLQEVCNKL
ncbi:peptidase S8/S53 domain-containing protein [Mycena rosella]|uniref:Peptidase S8/S53 domain-containing protein n=1 Tax=Mycena rosella TaxID=1033263 RepID=A0AAD7DSC1_MYCRO|nr:peptidase S8/S53 domain-containing protein [Mycena rosella]